MKSSIHLINNIIGQLEGTKKMMEEERDCFEISKQFKAVKSATTNLIDKYMEENFNQCMKNCKENKREDVCRKFFSEIIKKD